ncbi:MAG: hypothetical protein GX348_12275 [Veillonellaceae bacterium]|nr:hypothetical protein [Veillonellaceae bacterium]
MISRVTIIGLSDHSLDADPDTTMAIAILIAAFNPDLAILDCYQIIKDAAPIQPSSSGETIRYGKRYFYTRTVDNKVMFSVSKFQPETKR